MPPGAPIGSPQVMAYRSPLLECALGFQAGFGHLEAVSRSVLVASSISGRTLRYSAILRWLDFWLVSA